MRKLFLFILLTACLFSYGQFAIIYDKDGHTNIREDAMKGSNIVDSLENGHLIYCFEKKGNWINIDYTKGHKELLNGYIYNDRYKLISGYPAIPVLAETKSSIKFFKDSIEIILTQKPFDKTKHTFRYYKETNDQIELIDNKKYWGKDGGMPETEYQAIIIKIGQHKITLPKEATENLFEPSLYSTQVNVDKETNTIYIQSLNSDGAGGYEVIWKIEKGVYKGRFVAYGF